MLLPPSQAPPGDLTLPAIASATLVTIAVDAFVSQRWYWTIALVTFMPWILTLTILGFGPLAALRNGIEYWQFIRLMELWLAGVVVSGLSLGLSTLDTR